MDTKALKMDLKSTSEYLNYNELLLKLINAGYLPRNASDLKNMKPNSSIFKSSLKDIEEASNLRQPSSTIKIVNDIKNWYVNIKSLILKKIVLGLIIALGLYLLISIINSPILLLFLIPCAIKVITDETKREINNHKRTRELRNNLKIRNKRIFGKAKKKKTQEIEKSIAIFTTQKNSLELRLAKAKEENKPTILEDEEERLNAVAQKVQAANPALSAQRVAQKTGLADPISNPQDTTKRVEIKFSTQPLPEPPIFKLERNQFPTGVPDKQPTLGEHPSSN